MYISQTIINSNYYECKPHYLLYSRSLFMCRYKRIRKQKYIFHCPILFESHTCVWLYLCLYVCVLVCVRTRDCVFEYMGTRLKGYRAYYIATKHNSSWTHIKFRRKNIHTVLICEEFLLFLFCASHIGMQCRYW